MIKAKAPGKLVLFGEYAVLHGAPALVMAVDRYIHLEITPGDDFFSVIAPDIGVSFATMTFDTMTFATTTFESGPVVRVSSPENISNLESRLAFVSCAIRRACELATGAGSSLRGAKISIESSDFKLEGTKLGLGSSASLTVALLFGLLAGAQVELSRDGVYRAALESHRMAQEGVGSGVDIAASTYGGILVHRMDGEPEPTSLPPEIAVLPVWTGNSAVTKDLVGGVDDALRSSAQARTVLKRMVDLSEDGCRRVEESDGEGLLRLVNEYMVCFRDLGKESCLPLITPAHGELADLSSRLDVAYKPSGAGGGDIGLFFCRKDQTSAVKRAIDDSPYRWIEMKGSSRGVEIL